MTNSVAVSDSKILYNRDISMLRLLKYLSQIVYKPQNQLTHVTQMFY